MNSALDFTPFDEKRPQKSSRESSPEVIDYSPGLCQNNRSKKVSTVFMNSTD